MVAMSFPEGPEDCAWPSARAERMDSATVQSKIMDGPSSRPSRCGSLPKETTKLAPFATRSRASSLISLWAYKRSASGVCTSALPAIRILRPCSFMKSGLAQTGSGRNGPGGFKQVVRGKFAVRKCLPQRFGQEPRPDVGESETEPAGFLRTGQADQFTEAPLAETQLPAIHSEKFFTLFARRPTELFGVARPAHNRRIE